MEHVRSHGNPITHLQEKYECEQYQYKSCIVLCAGAAIILLIGIICSFVYNGVHASAGILLLGCAISLYGVSYFYSLLQKANRNLEVCQTVLDMIELENHTADTSHKPADIIPFRPRN